MLLDSRLKGLKFVGLILDVRYSLDKEVDVFDATHIIQGLKISSEIAEDGVVIFEEDLPDLNAQLEELYKSI